MYATNNIKFRLVAFLFIILIATILSPTQAFAHSQLVSSNPVNGQELQTSPKEIKIKFSEDVISNNQSIRLFNGNGDQIQLKSKVKNSDGTISADSPTLADGTYVVAWSIISADTHPQKGAFIFSINDQVKSDVLSNKSFDNLFRNTNISPLQKNVSNLNRFVLFVSLTLLIGSILLQIVLNLSINDKFFKRYIFALSAVCIVTTLLSMIFYVANVRNLGFFDSISLKAIGEELSEKYLVISLIRIVTVAITMLVWNTNLKIRNWIVVTSALFLAISLSYTGHASAGTFLIIAFIFDLIHVLAASTWFSGLVMMPKVSKQYGIDTIKKFSSTAMVCVISVAITGSFAFWRQVGTLDAATHTWFGKLLLTKITLFVLLIGVAYYTNRILRANLKENNLNRSKFLKYIYVEAILVLVILSLTSLLTNTIPAKTEYTKPIAKEIATNKLTFNVTVDPAKSGPVDIHVFVVDNNGFPYQFKPGEVSLTKQALELTLSNEKRHISDIPIEMRYQGLNHFVSLNANIPFSGVWDMRIRLQTGKFDTTLATTTIVIK